MRQATLCFLVKENQICLGLKKRGFGINRWNGFGGKVQGEESIEQAARREVKEEIGVEVKDLEKVAELTFFFPHQRDWDQVVHTYFVRNWTGEILEGEEMKPDWFDFESLPFGLMWPDDSYWLPKVLSGTKVKARFSFADGDKITDFEINEVREF